MAHFLNFIFTLYPYWIFFKRDKLLSNKIKYKYENIKLKKRMPSGSCLTSKLYDKIIKMPSKPHETIPLSGENLSADLNTSWRSLAWEQFLFYFCFFSK
jgi:hypothetical protein